jgi:hypothetical protein
MMKTIVTLLTLLLFTRSDASTDHVFEKAVERFKAKVPVREHMLESDSSVYKDRFIAMLDRELKTSFRKQHPVYAGLWVRTDSFDLNIIQFIFPKTIDSLPSRTIRPISKAPQELRFLQVKNRLIVFSYSPFYKGSDLENAIADFHNIYRELATEK